MKRIECQPIFKMREVCSVNAPCRLTMQSVQIQPRSVTRPHSAPSLFETRNLPLCFECPSLWLSLSIIYNPDWAHFTDLKCAVVAPSPPQKKEKSTTKVSLLFEPMVCFTSDLLSHGMRYLLYSTANIESGSSASLSLQPDDAAAPARAHLSLRCASWREGWRQGNQQK